MQNLLANWDEYKGLFLDPIFLISDYDGTLTPIVSRPGDAELSKDMKELLGKMARVCPVAIVSGRSLDDLKARVGLENLYYSGNHGLEITGPGIEFTKEEAKESRAVIEEICEKIMEKGGSIEGILVENKGLTASVHYRLVGKKDLPRLKRIVEKEISPYKREGLLEINHGKKVIEIRPDIKWNKGNAVSLLLNVVSLDHDTFPVYLGDDTTDEDVFSYLEDQGVSILISEEDKESSAGFRLNSVDEVGEFLSRLHDVLDL